MNKEEVDKFCKEYYGFTLEDADGSIGYWMGKYQELEQENKKLHNKIDKAIECMKLRFMNCIDNDKRYFEDYYIQEIYEILKDSDVDE